jgi:hypothetical protein
MKINDILVEFAPSGDSGGSGDYFQSLASAWYNGTFDSGSLQKGIKSQQDVEQLLNRGIIGPDGVTRKYAIDYNSTFDGVEIYSDDYYEYGDYDDTIDSRTGQKWGPYDFMEFSDDDLSEGMAEGVQTESAELAKQYGWAYNQGEYGVSMTHPKHGRISLSSPVTSRSGDTAVEREWTHNNANGIGDRSLAQHLQSLKEQGVTEGAPISGDGGAVDNFKQQMANRTELDYQKAQQDMAEGDRKPEPPEADYGSDYQDMVSRVKKLAGVGPLKTQYDPNKRVYRNMPTAVQPKK